MRIKRAYHKHKLNNIKFTIAITSFHAYVMRMSRKRGKDSSLAAKSPTNLSLHKRILELADQLQDRLGYSSLSTLVEALIREEYERRNGQLKINVQPPGEAGPKENLPARRSNKS
jgi:hypothetical protein